MTVYEQMHIVSGMPVKLFSWREGRAPVRLGILAAGEVV
jgi:hypothetical protein